MSKNKYIKRVVDLPRLLDEVVREKYPERNVNRSSYYSQGIDIAYNPYYTKDYPNGVITCVEINDYKGDDKTKPVTSYSLWGFDNKGNTIFEEDLENAKESELKDRTIYVGNVVFPALEKKVSMPEPERAF